MISLLANFLQSRGICFNRAEDEDPETDRDDTQYICVDGEEGDFGIVRHSINGELVAIEYVLGGDDYEIEFTSAGIKFYTDLSQKMLTESIEKINNEDHSAYYKRMNAEMQGRLSEAPALLEEIRKRRSSWRYNEDA